MIKTPAKVTSPPPIRRNVTGSPKNVIPKTTVKNGAKSVRALISHGVLSGKAYENIANSKLVELVVSDSLRVKSFKTGPAYEKIKTLTVADQIALAIYAIDCEYSYEALKKSR